MTSEKVSLRSQVTVHGTRGNGSKIYVWFFLAIPLDSSQAFDCPNWCAQCCRRDFTYVFFPPLRLSCTEISVVKASKSVRLLVEDTCSRRPRKGKNKAKLGFGGLFCQRSVTPCEFNKSLTESFSGKGNSVESPGF